MSENLYKWATENLSPSRARVFADKLREIESNKFSSEWQQARGILDSMERTHLLNNQEEIAEIQETTRNRVDALQKQIDELHREIEEVRAQGQQEVMKVRCAIYVDPTYVAQNDIVSELWIRDDEAIQPLRDALVAKYQAAQEKAGA